MKKTRFLIALLVMLVAGSAHAQDSYREAVKQYLNVDEKFERSKAIIPFFKMMFVNDGKVNLDQLNERYLTEQLADDYAESLIPTLQAQNITEADLQEVYSLLSTPQGKTYAAHKAEWDSELDSEITSLMLEAVFNMESAEGELELEPVQPDADIDAAFAAKMTKLLDDMSLVPTMIKKLAEPSSDDPEDEVDPEIIDWFRDNLPAIAVNTAYGILTDEDLDFGQMLFAKESYRKFMDLSNNNAVEKIAATLFSNYIDWMQAQGAAPQESPAAVMGLLKGLMNAAAD